MYRRHVSNYGDVPAKFKVRKSRNLSDTTTRNLVCSHAGDDDRHRMKPLRIVLADDHMLVRAGIRALLERIPGVEVAGEAGDGREALALLEALQPDILLIDIAMPGLNGLETAARVTNEFPRIKVIILTMHANEEYVVHALRAGAVGYLLKDSATIELELAIEAVGRGEMYLSPPVSRAVIDGYLSAAGATKTHSLTPRQREVLKHLAEGQSAKQIAFARNLSVKTVETHRAQLMERLGIHDVPGLVKYAMRVGLISRE
jgi:DNA-binding NarL/FixJ family response regulator